jgi:uracil-DNA glycosylase family 4
MERLAALALQIEWGADEALEDAPVDRFAMAPEAITPAVARVRAGAAEACAAAAAGAEPVGVVARAQAEAAAANTPEALRQVLTSFGGCALATTATNLVFSDGNAAAGLVVVGEAPGEQEDREGRPLVGEAGQFLDRMFASVGLSRADMLMTSLIPWRPPGGRPPTETEVLTCLPFLVRHLSLLRPRLVVTLGALPARALTGREDGIRKLRGRWIPLAVPGLPEPVPMLPMLHPAYILQTPGAKRDAWTDLIALRMALNALHLQF